MNQKKFNDLLFMVSAIAVLLSTALFMSNPEFMRYVFAAGAAGYAVSRLSFRYEGGSLRLKRLYRIQKLPGLLLVGASYFMFKPMLFGDKNTWIVLLTIAACIELYTVTVISRIEEKK